MTGSGVLQAAVDELYSQPLAEFTARRRALAAAAKKAGDRVAATAIAELRKPTLSADTVNRLVRTAPNEVQELLQLGGDLRTAEKALDAAGMRALGDRRRRLVNELAELAFEITGQSSPSPAVREEVTGTLNAALADQQVADRLVSGALVTRASWDGFGSAQLPEMAADLPLRPARPSGPAQSATAVSTTETARSKTATAGSTTATAGSTTAKRPRPASKTARPPDDDQRDTAGRSGRTQQADRAAAKAEAERAQQAERAERDKAEAKRAEARQAQQQQRADAAEKAATEAAQVAARAQELVTTIDRQISELNLQLAHQRQQLADAQRALRAAETRRREAQLAATRAGAAVH